MQNLTLKEILIKYEAGECTEEQEAIVETFYLQLPANGEETLSDIELIEAVDRVGSSLPVQIGPGKRVQLWPRMVAAAVLLISLGITGYLVFKPKIESNQIAKKQQTIIPGRKQATLTLANGQKIILTKGMSGQLARQGGITIGLDNQNAVAYSSSNSNENTTTVFNTLSTSIGEQSPYPLVLSDGTKVWLNAASSIKFPISFAGLNQRVVELTGEGYFSVNHNENIPFKVITRNQVTEDVGTEFNIEAYDDVVATRTTLVKGAIKVITGSNIIMLKPGQQAVANKEILFTEVNVDDVIAWKNGYFQFEDETLENIMRSISRWYNVQINFTDNGLKKDRYGLVATRLTDISVLLKQIEDSGNAHFKLEGETIIVSQKNK